MYIIGDIGNSEVKISVFSVNNKQVKKIVLKTPSINESNLNKTFSSILNLKKINLSLKKIKNLLKEKFRFKKIKVGHAGTLDPLATGLLVVCTGKSTKMISEIQNQKKEYTGELTIGATTPSYDLETEIDNRYDISNISEKDISSKTKLFIGEVSQKPPIFSAIKVKGERLYEKARRGEKINIKKEDFLSTSNLSTHNPRKETIDISLSLSLSLLPCCLCSSKFHYQVNAH